MAAQRVTNCRWMTLDAVRVMPGDSLGVMFSTMRRRVGAVRAWAGVRQVLMDRELFTTDVTGRLGGYRTRWLMPAQTLRA